MSTLKNYMMIFRYSPNPEYQPTEADLSEQRQAWGAFIGNIAIQEKLDSTHQLGFDGVQIAADTSTQEGIHISEGYTMGGNMIVKAQSMEEAVTMAKGCPILHMGGTVEVRDIIPMES